MENFSFDRERDWELGSGSAADDERSWSMDESDAAEKTSARKGASQLNRELAVAGKYDRILEEALGKKATVSEETKLDKKVQLNIQKIQSIEKAMTDRADELKLEELEASILGRAKAYVSEKMGKKDEQMEKLKSLLKYYRAELESAVRETEGRPAMEISRRPEEPINLPMIPVSQLAKESILDTVGGVGAGVRDAMHEKRAAKEREQEEALSDQQRVERTALKKVGEQLESDIKNGYFSQLRVDFADAIGVAPDMLSPSDINMDNLNIYRYMADPEKAKKLNKEMREVRSAQVGERFRGMRAVSESLKSDAKQEKLEKTVHGSKLMENLNRLILKASDARNAAFDHLEAVKSGQIGLDESYIAENARLIMKRQREMAGLLNQLESTFPSKAGRDSDMRQAQMIMQETIEKDMKKARELAEELNVHLSDKAKVNLNEWEASSENINLKLRPVSDFYKEFALDVGTMGASQMMRDKMAEMKKEKEENKERYEQRVMKAEQDLRETVNQELARAVKTSFQSLKILKNKLDQGLVLSEREQQDYAGHLQEVSKYAHAIGKEVWDLNEGEITPLMIAEARTLSEEVDAVGQVWERDEASRRDREYWKKIELSKKTQEQKNGTDQVQEKVKKTEAYRSLEQVDFEVADVLSEGLQAISINEIRNLSAKIDAKIGELGDTVLDQVMETEDREAKDELLKIYQESYKIAENAKHRLDARAEQQQYAQRGKELAGEAREKGTEPARYLELMTSLSNRLKLTPDEPSVVELSADQAGRMAIYVMRGITGDVREQLETQFAEARQIARSLMSRYEQKPQTTSLVDQDMAKDEGPELTFEDDDEGPEITMMEESDTEEELPRSAKEKVTALIHELTADPDYEDMIELATDYAFIEHDLDDAVSIKDVNDLMSRYNKIYAREQSLKAPAGANANQHTAFLNHQETLEEYAIELDNALRKKQAEFLKEEELPRSAKEKVTQIIAETSGDPDYEDMNSIIGVYADIENEIDQVKTVTELEKLWEKYHTQDKWRSLAPQPKWETKKQKQFNLRLEAVNGYRKQLALALINLGGKLRGEARKSQPASSVVEKAPVQMQAQTKIEQPSQAKTIESIPESLESHYTQEQKKKVLANFSNRKMEAMWRRVGTQGRKEIARVLGMPSANQENFYKILRATVEDHLNHPESQDEQQKLYRIQTYLGNLVDTGLTIRRENNDTRYALFEDVNENRPELGNALWKIAYDTFETMRKTSERGTNEKNKSKYEKILDLMGAGNAYVAATEFALQNIESLNSLITQKERLSATLENVYGFAPTMRKQVKELMKGVKGRNPRLDEAMVKRNLQGGQSQPQALAA